MAFYGPRPPPPPRGMSAPPPYGYDDAYLGGIHMPTPVTYPPPFRTRGRGKRWTNGKRTPPKHIHHPSNNMRRPPTPHPRHITPLPSGSPTVPRRDFIDLTLDSEDSKVPTPTPIVAPPRATPAPIDGQVQSPSSHDMMETDDTPLPRDPRVHGPSPTKLPSPSEFMKASSTPSTSEAHELPPSLELLIQDINTSIPTSTPRGAPIVETPSLVDPLTLPSLAGLPSPSCGDLPTGQTLARALSTTPIPEGFVETLIKEEPPSPLATGPMLGGYLQTMMLMSEPLPPLRNTITTPSDPIPIPHPKGYFGAHTPFGAWPADVQIPGLPTPTFPTADSSPYLVDIPHKADYASAYILPSPQPSSDPLHCGRGKPLAYLFSSSTSHPLSSTTSTPMTPLPPPIESPENPCCSSTEGQSKGLGLDMLCTLDASNSIADHAPMSIPCAPPPPLGHPTMLANMFAPSLPVPQVGVPSPTPIPPSTHLCLQPSMAIPMPPPEMWMSSRRIQACDSAPSQSLMESCSQVVPMHMAKHVCCPFPSWHPLHDVYDYNMMYNGIKHKTSDLCTRSTRNSTMHAMDNCESDVHVWDASKKTIVHKIPEVPEYVLNNLANLCLPLFVNSCLNGNHVVIPLSEDSDQSTCAIEDSMDDSFGISIKHTSSIHDQSAFTTNGRNYLNQHNMTHPFNLQLNSNGEVDLEFLTTPPKKKNIFDQLFTPSSSISRVQYRITTRAASRLLPLPPETAFPPHSTQVQAQALQSTPTPTLTSLPTSTPIEFPVPTHTQMHTYTPTHTPTSMQDPPSNPYPTTGAYTSTPPSVPGPSQPPLSNPDVIVITESPTNNPGLPTHPTTFNSSLTANEPYLPPPNLHVPNPTSHLPNQPFPPSQGHHVHQPIMYEPSTFDLSRLAQRPQIFNGRNVRPSEARTWLNKLENWFNCINASPSDWVTLAFTYLQPPAFSVMQAHKASLEASDKWLNSYGQFSEMFIKNYGDVDPDFSLRTRLNRLKLLPGQNILPYIRIFHDITTRIIDDPMSDQAKISAFFHGIQDPALFKELIIEPQTGTKWTSYDKLHDYVLSKYSFINLHTRRPTFNSSPRPPFKRPFTSFRPMSSFKRPRPFFSSSGFRPPPPQRPFPRRFPEPHNNFQRRPAFPPNGQRPTSSQNPRRHPPNRPPPPQRPANLNALKTTRMKFSRNNNHPRRFTKPMTCYRCNRQGHRMAQCPNKRIK